MGRALTVDDESSFGPRIHIALTDSAPIGSRQPVFGARGEAARSPHLGGRCDRVALTRLKARDISHDRHIEHSGDVHASIGTRCKLDDFLPILLAEHCHGSLIARPGSWAPFAKHVFHQGRPFRSAAPCLANLPRIAVPALARVVFGAQAFGHRRQASNKLTGFVESDGAGRTAGISNCGT